jgi:hypothetical protein
MSEPALIRRDGTVLGFDVGSRRIGVAIGSAFAAHARAVAVVDVHGNGPDWAAIERLLKEWKPDGLVVGDPLTLDGQDQPNRKRAQGFARPPLRRRARRRAQAPPRCGRPRCRGRGGDHRPLVVVAGRRHSHSLTIRTPP